jgi:hypothetical protein
MLLQCNNPSRIAGNCTLIRDQTITNPHQSSVFRWLPRYRMTERQQRSRNNNMVALVSSKAKRHPGESRDPGKARSRLRFLALGPGFRRGDDWPSRHYRGQSLRA